MYLKTYLMIVLFIGVIQAKVYRKIPSVWAREELKELQPRAPFKCYSCTSGSKEACVKKEKECKQENPICLTATGMAYVLQCTDVAYYNTAKKDCEDFNCEVAYCTESLCNA
ncbi:hypothetical protein OS493_018796 [Desmophyllum pertusum]|uniref:Uncharacterized protein n=1 Tax=Desmophyllum pertusum TaxID=174260 RepID=A0A9X0CWX6_9CNID|nr:hypothetical protein OS493_018796 [Desmophyllum pertusum]